MNSPDTVVVAPAVWELVSGTDATGVPVFSVLVKRSYRIIEQMELCRCDETPPLRKIDEYYDGGDPMTAAIRYESDLVAWKSATDVVVVGKAYAPDGVSCTEMEVLVETGPVRKQLRIIGNRRCSHRMMLDPQISEPEPFYEMELRYELAYGGKDLISDPEQPFYYPRNQLGRGIAVKNKPETIDELPMPNIEDPDDLLTPDRIILNKPENWVDQPLPQGVGWYQKTWYPRSVFVGSVPGFMPIDTVTAEEEMGLVPRDHLKLARQFRLPAFDVRFNNGASPGLAVEGLGGGDMLRIVNMSPGGMLKFSLPREEPAVAIDIGFGQTVPRPSLHTVCVRTEDYEVDLIWRFAVPYPGHFWLPEMNRLQVEVE
ncbi:MAG: DUF2169 domain-containing protein [Chitinispirillaceae bacterium]|nr:DUF2169 domain-containing protein [Chitinispirillaceae bacterium]